MMLKLFLLSLGFAISSSVTCDECWDQYSICEWNAQSAAYDECANIWEEGSQYPAFVKECIEQQAGNQVACYEEAGCFEAGNQDCWWKLWEFGCSPYQCESYTICTQEFINEQGCGQQLDSCSETCQHPEWEYVYEEIPECIRNHCGEIIQQCATSDACVEGIEGIANTCYNGQTAPTECMDATFIQDAENTPSALNLCGGDETCATDLQQIGECVINSQCSEEENQEKFKKVARAVRFKKLQKAKVSREFARRRRVERRRPASRVAVRQRRPRRKVQSRRGREARRVRPRVERRRRQRRKLQSSGGCCECTSSKDSPFCNSQCDEEICPLDSYCCNNQWDWICADAAANVCNGEEAYGYTSSYTPFDYGSDNSGSCCDCQSSKGSPYCNEECDSELCPLDPYCCNNSWDWICANSATDVCNGQDAYGYSSYDSYYYPSYDYSSYDNYNYPSSDYSSYYPYSYSSYDYGGYDSYNYPSYDYSSYGSDDYSSYNPYYYPTPSPSYGYSSYDYSSYDPYSYSSYDYSGYDSYGYNYPSYDYSSYDSGYDNYNYPSYDYSGYDSYGSDYGYNNYDYSGYDYSGYDYSGYDSCGPDSCGSGYDEPEEWEYDEEEIPTCIKEACGTQLAQCASSEACIEGIEDIANGCYNDNESPVECMNTLITESEGNGALGLCNGNEQCAADLQALGECVIQSANYGMCENEVDKKKKELLKGLVKGLQRIKKQRVERLKRRNTQKLSQQLKRREQSRFRPRPRPVRRERVSREERLRQDRATKASLARRGRLQRRHRLRPRGAVREQRLSNKMQARPRPGLKRHAREQRAARLASHRRIRRERRRRTRPAPKRKERRKLQSSLGCCECTDAKGSPFCNSECDAEICPLDSYCCNNQWDWICANAASNVCDGQDAYNYGPYSWDEPTYTPNEYGSENGGSCCECTSSKGEAYCNSECDKEICPLDPYCCNNQWDWICADAASNVCNGQEAYGYNSYDYYSSYGDSYSYPSYDYSSYDNYYNPSYDYSGYDSYNYPSYDYSSYDSYYNPSYDYNSYDYSSYDSYNYPNYDSYGYPSYYDYSSNYDYSSDYYGYDSYNTNTYSVCGEIPDIPHCIATNCCSDLSQCSSDTQCVSAVEGIAAECDHEDESAIAQCIEDVFINDVEQTKVYELCGGDQLCVASFTSLGQCVFYECFSSSAQYLVKSLKHSLESLRTTRANKLKKFNRIKSVRQQRAKTQLTARRQFLRNKELKRVQQEQFNQQRRKYVNKRREFNARMKAKRAKKVKA